MRVARVQAQAKINLTLYVLDRDDTTGYHGIVTLVQRIDLADDITIRTDVPGQTLDLTGPLVPEGGLGPIEKNLAYRAAVEFAERTGWPGGFEIELTKNIPVGGGLGGGSADAGGVLRALNALAPEPLTEDELWSTACALGSDVPFLTKEWPAAGATGRGIELTNIPDHMPPTDVLIVVPGFSISTADAYRWLDEDWSRVTREDRLTFNHFQPVVERRFPELRRIRELLLAKGADLATLAGSGSSVFGLFSDTPPSDSELGLDARVIRTRTSSRVVQVEVLE